MLQQNLSHKQQLRITPQQLQMLELFHLTTQQLEMRIKHEIEENPILELKEEDNEAEKSSEAEEVSDFQDWEEYYSDDIPDYKVENSHFFQADRVPDKPFVARQDFREDVKNQLSALNLNTIEESFARYLVDSLNDKGFLDIAIDTLADDYSLKTMQWIDEDQAERVLKCVQQLEPRGIGARSLQECMLIQLRHLNTKQPDVSAAIRLLEDHYQLLKTRNFDRIERALNIDEVELRVVLELLGSLNLIVVSTDESQGSDTVLPEFKVTVQNNVIEVSLTRQRSASLFISNRMKEMTNQAYASQDQRTFQYLKSKLNAAEWFVSAVRQRESTMLEIMRAIVNFQHDYFREGDQSFLKPMILKNVADRVGVDISTVSRITCNKYVDTPFGTIHLKSLFSEGLQTDKGEIVSTKVIQKVIEEVIRTEDKKTPYSDQQLAKLLSAKGYNIARRTVTKYREQLNFPAAQMRAFWA